MKCWNLLEFVEFKISTFMIVRYVDSQTTDVGLKY